MQFNEKQLTSFGLAGLVLSLTVHVLTLSGLYLVSNISIGALTVGMLAAWLFSSRLMRERLDGQDHPWKNLFTNSQPVPRYLFYFIAVYVVLNTALGLRLEAGSGYVDATVSAGKLRVLSGFWMLFYGLAVLIGLSDADESED